MGKNNCIEKTYCLYASDWHLIVMLLPFISKELDEKNKVYMKFEESIEQKINMLTSKLDFKNKNEISKLNWQMEINDEEYTDKEKIYIVSGNDVYILNMNKKIEKYYNDRDDKVKIINCFNVTDGENHFNPKDVNGYMRVLTTKGENIISKV